MDMTLVSENLAPLLFGLVVLVIGIFVLAWRSASEGRPQDNVKRPDTVHGETQISGISTESVVEPGLADETVPADSPSVDVAHAANSATTTEVESVVSRIRWGLGKTRGNLISGLKGLVQGSETFDRELFDDIESQLLMADLGVAVTSHIMDVLTEEFKSQPLKKESAVIAAVQRELLSLLQPCSERLDVSQSNGPFVILMVGVNGAGKTTTIGKLANSLTNQGKSVMLAAGDTFRAAAVEQLQEWGKRNDVPVIAQQSGADSASVIFDALQSARAKNIDILIADTAGRLQNKENLMRELTKIKRVMSKISENAPHEVMLVLDAGTGQNAISQATLFNEAVGVTGLTLTKLDGTAKGGVIFAIAKQMGLPIRFIGVGEKIDDLKPFDAEEFVTALFDEPE